MKYLIYDKNNKMVGYSTSPVICDDNVVEVDDDTYTQEVNKYTNNRNELSNLIEWFDGYYSQHEQKYRRLHEINKLTDDGKDPYVELIELYNEAEVKRKRIQELEEVVN